MITKQRILTFFFFSFAVLCAGSSAANAQVVPSAVKGPLSLNVGGTVSVFDPNYISNKLVGAGVYVDLNIFHGIGVEAEGRWQRFHETEDIHQDNYLIGPRVQVLHFWRARPYVKALGGFSNMTFEDNVATGRFTTFAFGGGIDLHVTRRWTVRAIDAEYQYWPTFLDSNLKPFGASAGVSYRIF